MDVPLVDSGLELLGEDALNRITAGEKVNIVIANPKSGPEKNPFAKVSPLSCSTKETKVGRIALLPQDVVNRIAAGEVVQKPVSAVKELLENCLDAGSTEVCVSIEGNGYSKIVIADNGCGIRSADLPLAAIRHATSKLHTIQDFDTLQSFGFRGEALASISMVSKLAIVSRTEDSKVGFAMQYLDGKPTCPVPKPVARKVGTTVTVDSLFYNLPHRNKKGTADDYQKILQVVQNYAIFYAAKGVGLVCEKKAATKNGNSTDLNTTSCSLLAHLRREMERDDPRPDIVEELQRRATKDIICCVYGSNLQSQLEPFAWHWKGSEKSQSFECSGFLSRPSYAATKKTIFLLFVNQRLVESRHVQRCLEDVYGEFTKSKPFLFVSLNVPPDAVDVNVHPTKREVALLYLKEICHHLAMQLRETLGLFGHSFEGQASYRSSLEPSVAGNNNGKRKRPEQDTSAESERSTNKPPEVSKQKVPPSKLIRTNRSIQVGALEPFLLSHPSQTQRSSSQSTQATTGSADENPSPIAMSSQSQHESDCPLLTNKGQTDDSVDLSQPGAFATLAAMCTCRVAKTNGKEKDSSGVPNQNDYTVIRLPIQTIVRPRKVAPTVCSYTSIRTLRESIRRQAVGTVQEQLRVACFVGVASTQRSLLQAGENLILINHYQAARELFYQLALDRFPGGALAAKLGAPVDVRRVVANFVALEELIKDGTVPIPDESLVINETTAAIAEQVASYLLLKADMLQEYFSIGIAQSEDGNDILLTSLPVLLENYTPCVHGLPSFLLRLATEVDWTEEKPCFEGICRELGSFYACLPSQHEELMPHIRHALFPAISTLLVPSQKLVNDGFFLTITKLSKLYRVFERC